MLQTYGQRQPQCSRRKLGQGVSRYRDFISRGREASEPQAGNSMQVTHLFDPHSYRPEFESPTDAPEETKLSELKS
jgi:hypothetical protein